MLRFASINISRIIDLEHSRLYFENVLKMIDGKQIWRALKLLKKKGKNNAQIYRIFIGLNYKRT